VVNNRGELFICDTGNNTIRKGILAADPPRFTNCSVLTGLTGATDTVILGAKLGGAETSGVKTLLLRAAGPSLSSFGVPQVVADPKVVGFSGASLVAQNDDWGGGADLSAAFAKVSAFPFRAAESADAALLHDFTASHVGMQVTGSDASGGQVLAEIYDASGPVFEPHRPRLTNVSVLRRLEGELFVGFMVGGAGTKTLLIRAVGPTLGASFGIQDALDDPNLAVYDSGGRPVARNESWSNAAHSLVMLDVFNLAGAFRLLGDSLDAAAVVTVPPGAYTVRVTRGIGKPAGQVLVEVYEMP
jgi:hypothetical protein